MSWTRSLDEAQKTAFERDGLLVLRSFYDFDADITPIQKGIHDIIGQVMRRHKIGDTRGAFPQMPFDQQFLDLVATDRSLGGEIYDAVKQIPAFIRLLGKPDHENLFRELRQNSVPGVAAGGHGIRIDIPGEDRYRAEWHQEYPSQLRSLDGLVFWSPLVSMTPEIGPVRFCLGSHRHGLQKVTSTGSGQTGAYALRLCDEANVVSHFEQSAPLLAPGDLAVVDFLTLHASGHNISDRARWSLQFRYFNFSDPTGMRHGWKGSFAAGVDFRSIHPELCVES